MNKIIIKSNKELQTPVTRFSGIVTVEIEWYQREPELQRYALKIKDTFTKTIDTGEKDILDEPIILTETEVINRPIKYYNDIEINQIANLSNIDLSDKNKLTENLDKIFKIGLLEKTKQECRDGVGIYFSEESDWEILTENNN